MSGHPEVVATVKDDRQIEYQGEIYSAFFVGPKDFADALSTPRPVHWLLSWAKAERHPAGARGGGAVSMIYTAHYDSPLGGLFLAADEEGLTGLWFEDAAHFADGLPIEREETETPVLGRNKKVAGSLLFGSRAGISAEAAPGGIEISAGGLGVIAGDPIRPDHDLWSPCAGAGATAGENDCFGASCWRSHRAQSDLDPDPVPPRCGKRWKSDRIRGRAGEKSTASEAGRHCDRTLLLAGEKGRIMRRKRNKLHANDQG